jgi:predicted nucleotidyltransferase
VRSLNVLDEVINKRYEALEKVKPFGVKSLKVYGSVLSRSERPDSDIDFLLIFDDGVEYNRGHRIEVGKVLEELFNRRIGTVDTRNYPDVFETAISADPIDIMELEYGKTYNITPKSSDIYYQVLKRNLESYYKRKEIVSKQYSDADPSYSYEHSLIARQISWWFSRLLRLQDNDLREYDDFYFADVLMYCEKAEFGVLLGDEYDADKLEGYLALIYKWAVERTK